MAPVALPSGPLEGGEEVTVSGVGGTSDGNFLTMIYTKRFFFLGLADVDHNDIHIKVYHSDNYYK